MAVVQVPCERCGTVRMSPRRIEVYPETNEVRFVCPVCRQRAARIAPAEIILQLKAAGARIVIVPPALTADDLLDFHENFDDEIRELLG